MIVENWSRVCAEYLSNSWISILQTRLEVLLYLRKCCIRFLIPSKCFSLRFPLQTKRHAWLISNWSSSLLTFSNHLYLHYHWTGAGRTQHSWEGPTTWIRRQLVSCMYHTTVASRTEYAAAVWYSQHLGSKPSNAIGKVLLKIARFWVEIHTAWQQPGGDTPEKDQGGGTEHQGEIQVTNLRHDHTPRGSWHKHGSYPSMGITSIGS